MKYIIAVLSILAFSCSAYASPQVWKSSNTATADTTKNLCVNKKGILHGVMVNTGSAGTLTVYASSATATNPIAAVNTANAIGLLYDVEVSTVTGLTYTNSATANVTLTYTCY